MAELFHFEEVNQEPYLVKMWVPQEHWVMMTEADVEWLIDQLHTTTYGRRLVKR